MNFKNGVLDHFSTPFYYEEDQLVFLPSANFKNITQITLELIFIDMDALPSLSKYLPYLRRIEFLDCCFRYSQGEEEEKSMFTKTIPLTDTDIDTLYLESENKSSFISGKIGLISLDSDNQNFSKGFICTSTSSRSMVEEFSYNLYGPLRDEMDWNETSLLKIRVKSIKNLFVKSREKNSSRFNIKLSFP
jgi:hypothetical protein